VRAPPWAKIETLLRHEVGEESFKILPHSGVGIFVYRQRGRRVFDKHLQQACFYPRKFRQLTHDLVGDEMKPSRTCFQQNFLL